MSKKKTINLNIQTNDLEPNYLIIEKFKQLIKLLEYETNNLIDPKQKMLNQFRISSFKKSLKIIQNIPTTITNLQILSNIKGIGKGTISRIEEILKTGSLDELKDYDKIIKKNQNKESIISDLMKVIGIGRIMALQLIETYNIKSADELKKLSDSDKIKLNDKIKLGLKYLGKFQGMIPKSEIDQIYDYLQDMTNKYNPSMFITICGSYRRGLPVSSDIDILLSDLNCLSMDDIVLGSANILASYVKYLHKIGFLIDDLTDKDFKTKYMGFGKFGQNGLIRRVDIRLIPMISYFPALLYFTGSYTFNQEMRANAKKLGYKLNEYGLYDNRTDEQIIVLSEQEMFRKLGMVYLDPDKR